MKKLVNTLAAITMAATLTACSSSSSTSAYSGETTGTAKGMNGDVTVTLTLKDGKITDCTAEGKDETPGKGDVAIEEVTAQIKETGKISVDATSGATVTSDAIVEAAKAALESAGLTASDYE